MQINAIQDLSLTIDEIDAVDEFFTKVELGELGESALLYMLLACADNLNLQTITPFAKSIGKSYNGCLMSNNYIEISGVKFSSADLAKVKLIVRSEKPME